MKSIRVVVTVSLDVPDTYTPRKGDDLQRLENAVLTNDEGEVIPGQQLVGWTTLEILES